VHPSTISSTNLSRPAIETRVRESGQLRAPAGRHRSGSPHAGRADRIPPRGGQYPVAPARARGDPIVGAIRTSTPSCSRPIWRARPFLVRAGRGGARRVNVEAASGAAASLQSARDNVKEPAPLVVKIALENAARRAALARRTCAAFTDLDDLQPARRIWPDASTEASAALHGFCDYWSATFGPNSRGRSGSAARSRGEAPPRRGPGACRPTGCSPSQCARAEGDPEEFRREASRLDSGIRRRVAAAGRAAIPRRARS